MEIIDKEEEEFLLKPSIAITNTVPFTGKQLDLYNFLIKGAIKQLEKNYVRETFIFSYAEIKKENPRLKSEKMIKEFFKEMYEKDFEYNILGKDSSVESKVNTRAITTIKKNSDNTIEIGLEPHTIGVLRKLIMKKKNIPLPEDKLKKLGHELKEKIEKKKPKEASYAKFKINKDISYYPSKVIYELIHDYKNFMPEINIDDFKAITDTVRKYKENYNKKVIEKIREDLTGVIPGFSIELIKVGRTNVAVRITSSLKAFESFEDYYERYLKETNLIDNEMNRKMAKQIYDKGRKIK